MKTHYWRNGKKHTVWWWKDVYGNRKRIKDLEDSHLLNIIRYMNPQHDYTKVNLKFTDDIYDQLVKEALRRGFMQYLDTYIFLNPAQININGDKVIVIAKDR